MHEIFLAVRDYECDLQGIVNNAVYQNYFEHARHEYIKTLGSSFSEYIDQGIFLVLVQINLKFKKSLKAQDEFKVCTQVVRHSTLKFGFEQTIYYTGNDQKYTEASSIVVAKNKEGRVIVHNLLDQLTS